MSTSISHYTIRVFRQYTIVAGVRWYLAVLQYEEWGFYPRNCAGGPWHRIQVARVCLGGFLSVSWQVLGFGRKHYKNRGLVRLGRSICVLAISVVLGCDEIVPKSVPCNGNFLLKMLKTCDGFTEMPCLVVWNGCPGNVVWAPVFLAIWYFCAKYWLPQQLGWRGGLDLDMVLSPVRQQNTVMPQTGKSKKKTNYKSTSKFFTKERMERSHVFVLV